MISLIDNLAGEVSRLYVDLIRQLRVEHINVVTGSNPAMPEQRRSFESVASVLLNGALGSYETKLSQSLSQIVETALDGNFSGEEIQTALSGKNKKLLDDYIKDSLTVARRFFWVAGSKDVSLGVDQLRQIGFDVAVAMNESGMSNAVKGAVVKNLVNGGVYVGKNAEWRTITQVKLTTRMTLLQAYNDAIMFVASKLGESDFLIQNGKNHRYNGMEISIKNNDFMSQRAKIFHPRSKSLVKRKISH